MANENVVANKPKYPINRMYLWLEMSCAVHAENKYPKAMGTNTCMGISAPYWRHRSCTVITKGTAIISTSKARLVTKPTVNCKKMRCRVFGSVSVLRMASGMNHGQKRKAKNKKAYPSKTFGVPAPTKSH